MFWRCSGSSSSIIRNTACSARACRTIDEVASEWYAIADCRSWTRVLPWREVRRKRARKGAGCGANKNDSYVVLIGARLDADGSVLDVEIILRRRWFFVLWYGFCRLFLQSSGSVV